MTSGDSSKAGVYETYEITVRVRPEDIDELGHVNNVHYLRWVQEAAVAHWRALAPPEDQERLLWVVLRHEIDYRHAARLEDGIVARTWVGKSTRITFERLTEIRRAAGGQVLAKARTLWCPIDAKTRRPVQVSPRVRKIFSAAPGGRPGAQAGGGEPGSGEVRQWRPYTDLAWTEPIVSSPEDSAGETERFVRMIREHASIEVRTLLHLGCGAGANDYTFKRHFRVTGVDSSREMLELARKLNPESRYLRGDMRTVELAQRFDAVAIPDSIMHLLTAEDIRRTMATAVRHLRPGGVLLVGAYVKEDYRENNFVYAGSRDGVEVTIFENNHPAGETCQTTVVYLIRRGGTLDLHHDGFTGGLFPEAFWISVFRDAGLETREERLEHPYDRYLAGEGEYVLRLFIGRRPETTNRG